MQLYIFVQVPVVGSPVAAPKVGTLGDLAACELHMEPPPCAPDHFVWHHPEVFGAPMDAFGRKTTSSYPQEANCDVALDDFYLYGRKQWALRQDMDLIQTRYGWFP